MRVLLSLLFVFFASILWAQDEGSRVERLLESQLSGDDRVVEIEGFEGVLTGQASLDVLTIADADGVWLRIEDAVLDWNRAALLRGRLAVTELSAARIAFPRLPLPAEEVPDVEASGTGLPELPVAIRIDRIAVERAELGAPLIGVAAVVDFEGSLSLEDGEGAADITANRLDGPRGAFVLQAGYSNATRELDLNLTLDEDEGGLAAELINLPGRPSVGLSLTGGGALDALALDFSLATGGIERLTGQARTRTAGGDAPVAFAVDLGGDAAVLFAPEYQDFLGSDLALSASGTRGADGALSLDALSLDAQSLRLTGSGAIGSDGAPERFALEGDLASGDETPVRLPVAGAEITVARATLALDFDAVVGPDWSGTIRANDVLVDDLGLGRLVLTGDGRIEEGAVTAALELTADDIVPPVPELSEAFGETVVARTLITSRTGEPLRLTDLEVTAQTLAASGAATFDFADRDLEIDARLAVDASDLRAFAALAGQPLAGQANLEVTASGRLVGGTLDLTATGQTRDLETGIAQLDPYLIGVTDLDADISRGVNGISVNRLVVRNEQAEILAEGNAASDEGGFEATAQLNSITPILPDAEGPATLALEATGSAANWTFELQVDAAGAEVIMDGDAVLGATPSGDVTLRMRAPDLARFAGIAERPLSGSFEAIAQIAGVLNPETPLDSLGTIAVSGIFRDVTTGISEVDAYVNGQTVLDFKVEQSQDGITLDRIWVNNPAARLEGRGALRGQDGSVLLVAVLEDVSPLLADLSGRAALKLEGVGVSGLWGFSLDGSLDDAALTAQGKVRPFDEDPSGDVVFELDAQDISRFAGIADRPLAGAVDLEGRAEGVFRSDAPLESTGSLDVSGTATDLATGVAQVDPYFVGEMNLEVSGSRTADGLLVEALRLRSDAAEVDASGRWDGENGAGRAVVSLDDVAPLLAEASGPGRLDIEATGTDQSWEFEAQASAADAEIAAEGTATLGDVPSADVALSLQAGDLSRFAPLVGRPLAGAVTAEGTVAGRADLETFDIDLALDGQDIRIGQRDVDTLLAGDITARIDAQKNGERVNVRRADLNSDAITVQAVGQLGGPNETMAIDVRVPEIAPFTGSIRGAATASGTLGPLQNGRLGVDLEATGPAGLTAEVSGAANVETLDLDLALSGGGPAALANRFILPRTVDGPVTFRGTINGPPALSSVAARLEGQALSVVLPAFGLVLDPLNATASLANSSVFLEVAGQGREGGRLSVTGPVQLTGAPSGDLVIELDALRVSDPNLYDSELDARINVNGPLAGGATVSGRVALGQTEVRIPSTGFGASALDGLQHVNEPFIVRQTRARAGLVEVSRAGPAVSYGLDLVIDAPNRIFLRGRGLDAELGGQLQVGGSTLNPVAVGAFELIRGRLDILGRRLTLTEGRATLEGSLDPALRLVATTETEDVEVRIVIEGQASSPDIRFESDPDLPEDEVLAQLLFGRGIDTLSPLQAAQLASAVATLAGRGGDGIVGRLRASLGFDDLDVATSETGATDLRIGRYLGENLYTDVTIGSDGRSEVSLNLDLTPSVSVQGAVSNDGSSSVGIFYQRDY